MTAEKDAESVIKRKSLGQTFTFPWLKTRLIRQNHQNCDGSFGVPHVCFRCLDIEMCREGQLPAELTDSAAHELCWPTGCEPRAPSMRFQLKMQKEASGIELPVKLFALNDARASLTFQRVLGVRLPALPPAVLLGWVLVVLVQRWDVRREHALRNRDANVCRKREGKMQTCEGNNSNVAAVLPSKKHYSTLRWNCSL